MAKRQTRRSISVNAALYELIASQSAGANQSISEWLSVLVRDELTDSGLEVPEQQFTREIIANRASVDEAIAARHRRRAALRAKNRASREAQDAIDLDLRTTRPDARAINAVVTKQHGAINAVVTTGFCALCVDDLGPFVLRPLGKNDALVQICDDCDGANPGKGRNSFGSNRSAMGHP